MNTSARRICMDLYFTDYDLCQKKREADIKYVSCFADRETDVVLDLLGRQETQHCTLNG